MQIKLIDDDHKQIYVWVRADDPEIKVSPHFDYREDAMQWFENHSDQWDHYSGLPATNAYI